MIRFWGILPVVLFSTCTSEIPDISINNSDLTYLVAPDHFYSTVKEWPDNFCNGKEFKFYVDIIKEIGSLKIGNSNDGTLYIDLLMTDGWMINDINIAIGYRNLAGELFGIPIKPPGFAVIDNFPYRIQQVNSNQYFLKLGGTNDFTCVSIAANLVVSNSLGVERSIWAEEIKDPVYFMDGSMSNFGIWSKLVKFCPNDCEEIVDFTFAWEDLQDGNDADYNDLVMKSVVQKWIENDIINLKLKFIASARGASFDHRFKVNLPIFGKYEIFDNNDNIILSGEGDGKVELVVIESTKSVLPKNNIHFSIGANTDPALGCISEPVQAIYYVKILNGELKPFELSLFKTFIDPFIEVYPSKSAFDDSKGHYSLHIWEITNTDTWTSDEFSGEYPNGIIIPNDWYWPIEKSLIWSSYPDFKSIENWNPAWALNGPEDSSSVFIDQPCL